MRAKEAMRSVREIKVLRRELGPVQDVHLGRGAGRATPHRTLTVTASFDGVEGSATHWVPASGRPRSGMELLLACAIDAFRPPAPWEKGAPRFEDWRTAGRDCARIPAFAAAAREIRDPEIPGPPPYQGT